MFGLDIIAIFVGVFSGLILSVIIGGLLGAAMIMDDKDLEDEAKLVAQFSNPSVAFQVIVLSLGTSVLSGAVTAWMANSAAYLNAGIVGIIAVALGLALPMPEGFPEKIRLITNLATIPATLLGAWLLA